MRRSLIILIDKMGKLLFLLFVILIVALFYFGYSEVVEFGYCSPSGTWSPNSSYCTDGYAKYSYHAIEWRLDQPYYGDTKWERLKGK